MTNITAEKADLLTPEQKKVKQTIMEDLLAALYANIEKNQALFDGQGITDLIIASYIMFSRDVLLDFIEQSNIKDFSPTASEKFLDKIFEITKSEILVLQARLHQEKNQAQMH